MRLFTVLFLIAVSSDAKKHRKGQSRPKQPEEYNEMLERFEFKRDDPRGDKFVNPVLFGHIFREGFEDPSSNYKPPIDLLELSSRYVTDGPSVKELIKNNPNKYVPLNEYAANQLRSIKGSTDAPSINLDRKNMQGIHGSSFGGGTANDTIQTYWNLEGLLTRNLQEPPQYRLGGGQMPQRKRIEDEGPTVPISSKFDFFSKQSYVLKEDIERQRKVSNFTSCDEFGKHAKFHPNDIVNIDWIPFYIWIDDNTAVVRVSRIHQFSFPTEKFVQNFKDKYESFINKTVDWEQPKLVLRHDQREILLVAVDRSGLFDAIPAVTLPSNIKNNPSWLKIYSMRTRLKIVDPYLALMYCDLPYTVIMAISGSEPRYLNQCTAEAAVLKFTGNGFPVARDKRAEEQEAMLKAALAEEGKQGKFIFTDEQ